MQGLLGRVTILQQFIHVITVQNVIAQRPAVAPGIENKQRSVRCFVARYRAVYDLCSLHYYNGAHSAVMRNQAVLKCECARVMNRRSPNRLVVDDRAVAKHTICC